MPPSERIKSVIGTNEIDRPADLCKSIVAEALGTLFITYFGCVSSLTLPSTSTAPSFVLISLTFGFVVVVAVQSLSHVSGANFNPAITCGLLVTGRITIIRGLLYIIAQSAGGIGGAALIKGLTPTNNHDTLGSTAVHQSLSIAQGFGIEFILGFLLVLVVFGVIDPNKPDSKIPASMAIGLAVAVGHLSSMKYTGPSMNPARSLGPAVIANFWENHWVSAVYTQVFWVGPCSGGIIAALLYHFLFTAVPNVPANDKRSKQTPERRA